VTITKSIKIEVGSGVASLLVRPGINGIVIGAGSSDVVTLRNLTVDGLGTWHSAIEFIAGFALDI